MTKIYVKLYSDFVITGSVFMRTRNTELQRIVFSPDNKHSVSVVCLKNGTLLFTNEANMTFDFSISRNRRPLAVVVYRANATSLAINNNWLLTDDGVRNWTINQNPDLAYSENMNIDFNGTALARIDFKINESSVAGAFFTERDLLFVPMNGNHVYPRLCEHISSAASILPLTEQRVVSFLNNNPDFAETLREPVNENQVLAFLDENPEFARKVGKTFFQRLMKTSDWLSK